MKKVISKFCSTLSTLILLAIILAAGGIMLLKAIGWQPMGILSGSMEPSYHVGGLVFINTNAAAESVAPGDTIAFYLSEDTVVTHRVIEVDAPARLWFTKGDNNDSEDLAPVPFENLIGKAAKTHIPYAGTILMNLRTKKGFAGGALLLAVLIILFVIPVFLAPPKAQPEPKPEGEEK
jgi:signal peptidase